MYKKFYTHFLKNHGDKIHMAAHSHHFWPDVTREAHLQYWDDSARFSDEKWGHIFGEVIPETQKLIAKNLNLNQPECISFAPNTHELFVRLLSALDWSKPVRILSTDSEFHSFRRQSLRLQETGKLVLDLVPTEPFQTLDERLQTKLKNEKYDMVFLSQVFFNSGIILSNIEKLVSLTPKETLFVLDGYHGFMCVPTDLSTLEGKIYYMAGGYKYAQGGEGACFMVSPKSSTLRPIYTGWFASFSTLESDQKNVSYDQDYFRFMGSTFDPSGIYRLRASLNLFQKENLTVASIHAYVQNLQRVFLKNLSHPILHLEQLVHRDLNHHGHFLTFKLPTNEATKELSHKLTQKGVLTDFRGNRLRFGFALYHNENDIIHGAQRISE